MNLAWWPGPTNDAENDCAKSNPACSSGRMGSGMGRGRPRPRVLSAAWRFSGTSRPRPLSDTLSCTPCEPRQSLERAITFEHFQEIRDNDRQVSTSFDGIILGAGHNALILQAYLSRCGLRTLSLDRAPIPGGGLMSIDNPRLPGFRHNPHSFFHRALTAMPWYRDLELERHGVHYLEPKLNVAMILRDGRVLEWWTDLNRTVDACAEFSKRDAEALRRLAEEFKPIVQKILLPEAQSPPLEPGIRRQLLERSAPGRRLLEISALSPLEFVTRHFESDAV